MKARLDQGHRNRREHQKLVEKDVASLSKNLLGSAWFACSQDLQFQARDPKEGPENDFLLEFLASVEMKVPRGCSVTLFQEPRLESGFPDLVIVVWHTATAERWNSARENLTNIDFRLIHHLTSQGPSSIESLESLFGRGAFHSLQRLEDAELIRQSGRKYIPRPLSRSYAVRHIIAVEAKVKEWKGALDQAFLNTWFASTSFVLMPRLPREDILRERATSMGVCVWNPNETVLDIRRLEPRSEPLSYVSWQFNDWAWRAAQNEQKDCA